MALWILVGFVTAASQQELLYLLASSSSEVYRARLLRFKAELLGASYSTSLFLGFLNYKLGVMELPWWRSG